MFQLASVFRLGAADPHAVSAAGLELVREKPLTRAELSRVLSERWPAAEPQHLGYAVTTHARLVHVTPRGLWGAGGPVAFAPSDDWLAGHEPVTTTVDELVLRYLAAFGPASVADARTWSRLTGLREVFERLRPRLRTFRDERGRELFDVPDAPFPDPDTPAPPRFLPEYDNVALSHVDRSRIIGPGWPGQPPPGQKWIGSLLVDGFYRGRWRITTEGKLQIEGVDPTPEIEAEGRRLLELVSSAAR
jgi:Winged helix DNA-binding domain